jgi:hypothetical protein
VPISDRIVIDRSLTPWERDLITWLLQHASDSGVRALPQIESARVAARCGCGCGSIDLRIRDTERSLPATGMEIVADYWWRTRYGRLCGAFVFLLAGRLTGLDVWSIDGDDLPIGLPAPYELWPY